MIKRHKSPIYGIGYPRTLAQMKQLYGSLSYLAVSLPLQLLQPLRKLPSSVKALALYFFPQTVFLIIGPVPPEALLFQKKEKIRQRRCTKAARAQEDGKSTSGESICSIDREVTVQVSLDQWVDDRYLCVKRTGPRTIDQFTPLKARVRLIYPTMLPLDRSLSPQYLPQSPGLKLSPGSLVSGRKSVYSADRYLCTNRVAPQYIG